MPLTKQVYVTQATIDGYGRINGDNDIIHYDHDYALERGFRGTLAHGLMVMAYAAELGAKRHGADWFRNGEIEVKWIGPVCPGDDLSVVLGDDGQINATVEEGPVMVGRTALAGQDG